MPDTLASRMASGSKQEVFFLIIVEYFCLFVAIVYSLNEEPNIYIYFSTHDICIYVNVNLVSYIKRVHSLGPLQFMIHGNEDTQRLSPL